MGIAPLNQLTFNLINFLGIDVKMLSFHVYVEITDDNMLFVLDTMYLYHVWFEVLMLLWFCTRKSYVVLLCAFEIIRLSGLS